MLTATHQVATPVNWKPGEDVIIVRSLTEEDARRRFPEGWDREAVSAGGAGTHVEEDDRITAADSDSRDADHADRSGSVCLRLRACGAGASGVRRASEHRGDEAVF
jgi:hypothetical protein